MDSIADLCLAFDGTYAGDAMRTLSELYTQIELETSSFCKQHEIACAEGCGTCCEHFMPDITTAEARLVAAYLLFVKRDRALMDRVLEFAGNTSGPCPLYRFDSPYHCSVYAARPLICRLFGACASQDKEGNALFRRCRFNKEETMPLLLKFTEDVPVMQDYSYALRSLDDGEGVVGYLPEKVASMMDQLQFLARMLEFDDSNPDDTPNPLAS
ncbi:MAG: YkgJ family cysteine cluster protein [Sphaerochaeta sp.]|uniref:YkgJ family cysteine cluster protein n=1 Tax=Sphaerochaeta sp. TaxID=1972642 RepID=UPI002973C15D|nr:YkgJ family cysteine cluster protein [Sphaerochaeta sp.]